MPKPPHYLSPSIWRRGPISRARIILWHWMLLSGRFCSPVAQCWLTFLCIISPPSLFWPVPRRNAEKKDADREDKGQGERSTTSCHELFLPSPWARRHRTSRVRIDVTSPASTVHHDGADRHNCWVQNCTPIPVGFSRSHALCVVFFRCVKSFPGRDKGCTLPTPTLDRPTGGHYGLADLSRCDFNGMKVPHTTFL